MKVLLSMLLRYFFFFQFYLILLVRQNEMHVLWEVAVTAVRGNLPGSLGHCHEAFEVSGERP